MSDTQSEKGKDEYGLTNDQRFAIAFAAGVPIDFHADPQTGVVTMTTRDPCAVVIRDGKPYVFTRPT